MNKTDVINTIENLFSIACLGLFESLNCTVEAVSDADIDIEADVIDAPGIPVACIDAGSTDVELIICLQIPPSTLANTYPVPNQVNSIDSECLEDWISELSNQLIGRFKALLITHNCFISLGLPTSYPESNINELLTEGCHHYELFFDLGGELSACFMSIEMFSDTFVFSQEATIDLDITEPGGIDLF